MIYIIIHLQCISHVTMKPTTIYHQLRRRQLLKQRTASSSTRSALQAPLPAGHCKLLYQQRNASSSTNSTLQAPLSAAHCKLLYQQHTASSSTNSALQAPLPAAHCKLLYQQRTASSSTSSALPLRVIPLNWTFVWLGDLQGIIKYINTEKI